jgi:signal transduction histidine kinase
LSSERRIYAGVLIEETEHEDWDKEDFLAALVHQLRTPLTTIQTWTQILRFGEGDLQKGLAQIERSTNEQSRLLEDLLDLSHIRSGTVQLKLSVLDPADCLSAAIGCVRAMADEKSVAIETEFGSSAAQVNADAGRLQQVFRNLLTNAIKFTPSMGRITVRMNRTGEPPDEQVLIQVKDTGKGIAAGVLPTVFTLFTQPRSATTQGLGRLNLRLSIVRHLVNMQGGAVTAESAGEGKGAAFTVTFPAALSATGTHGS